MGCAEFDAVQEVPYPVGEGKVFYVQRMVVDSVDYRMLFFPLELDSASCRARLEGELGQLPDHMYEVKFVLGQDFEDRQGFQFCAPKDLGLPSWSRAGLTALGEGLIDGIMRFGESIRTQGFVAMALDDKPKLNLYYSRVLKANEDKLIRVGYHAKSCLGGQGYALFRTSIAASCDKTAIA